MTVLTVQRLIETTGMTWTYMSDGMGWTAISDKPTTIAPLKAVLITMEDMYAIDEMDENRSYEQKWITVDENGWMDRNG